jgi:hypothetical protein
MSRITQKRIAIELVTLASLLLLPFISNASTDDGTIQNQYAWGENTGWVNFLPTGGNIHVTNTGLSGNAWDANYGWINLAPSQGGVKNDGEGNLSGDAWSAGGGYIDFGGVKINSSGKFTGTANGTRYGRLTFDCDHCNVTTDWRPTSRSPGTSVSSSGSGSSGFISSVYNSIFSQSIAKPETPNSNNQTANVNGKQNTEVATAYSTRQDKSKLASSTTSKNISQVKPYSPLNKNSISSLPIWKSILAVVIIALVGLVIWKFVVLRI